ncbi:MAG: TIGR02147 family protein [Proteobacteria bacterium]|nr:TIGR02147 family protein [Pseudomonadota bacterium]
MKSPNLYTYIDYSDFLTDLFEFKKSLRPSLRQSNFAKQIGLTASVFSEVCKKTRDIPSSNLPLVIRKLGLSTIEGRFFVDLVQLRIAKRKNKLIAASEIEARLNLVAHADRGWDVVNLEEDQPAVLKSWIHMAAKESLNLSDFILTRESLARLFQIDVEMAESVIRDLVKDRFIEPSDRSFQAKSKNVTTTKDVPSAVIQEYNRGILDLAKNKMNKLEVHQRDYSTCLMAADATRIEAAKEMIKNFRRGLMTYLEGGTKKNALFCFSAQLFRIDDPFANVQSIRGRGNSEWR